MDKKLVQEWYRIADSDLALAEFILAEKLLYLEAICFWSQQSVEKFLKGYLIAHGKPQSSEGHDLLYLCTICQRYDAAFAEIAEMCEELTTYGEPYMPGDYFVDEGLMRRALSFAGQIKDFAPLAELRAALEQDDEEASP